MIWKLFWIIGWCSVVTKTLQSRKGGRRVRDVTKVETGEVFLSAKWSQPVVVGFEGGGK